jgi:ABC-type sugar transport system ATPase subunit
MNDTLIAMRGITKFIYGSDGKPIRNTDVKILNAVDFDLAAGEVHVLVGENGAGKSTLMKILGGIIPPDAGELRIGGQRTDLLNARDAREKGIAFIHQELNLCPNLDVAHNMFLGREPRIRWIKDAATMYEKSSALLKALSCDLDPRTLVSRLSTAQQQIVEIAKAMSFQSRVVIMDEPTASLTKREIDMLFDLIKRMRADGMGIVYISHRFEEFLEVGDRLSVLRDGRSVGGMRMSEFDPDTVIRMMAGHAVDEMYPRTHPVREEPVLEVKGLRLTPRTPPIDLTVNAGEVVGLGGLVGSGRTELAKSIFGVRDFAGGEVRYLGRKTTSWSPGRLIAAGMAYLSEDRKTEGLVLGMNIRENMSLASLGSVSWLGMISRPKEQAQAGDLIEQLSIVARSVEQPVATLSGGNQQKCVLGKWLSTAPRLLILDEPTRGIDVGAKAQIHKLIDQIAGTGVAILMISSELPELIGMSDRIYIMRAGGVVAELAAGPELTQEKVVEYSCLERPAI